MFFPEIKPCMIKKLIIQYDYLNAGSIFFGRKMLETRCKKPLYLENNIINIL